MEAPSKQTFVPSEAFNGARTGYVYKMGPRGLGYYLDIKKSGMVSEDDQVESIYVFKNQNFVSRKFSHQKRSKEQHKISMN